MKRPLFVACSLVLVGCMAGDDGVSDSLDAAAMPTGKADSGYSTCQLSQVLTWVNDDSTDVDTLRGAGLARNVAKAIMSHRLGTDETPGTDDDDPFDTFEELDKVPYVGPKTLAKLVDAVDDACVASSSSDREIVFSPQPYETSHVARVVQLIDSTEHSIDIAMYSFSDTNVVNALGRAVKRGVTVRLVFNQAAEDRKSPKGTTSARLEELGVDVRWINKIMHHKMAIFDGPRESLDQAARATLVTGSANWSNGAATKYDENTIVIRKNAEAVLSFQREFNLLWTGSRDLVWNQELTSSASIDVPESAIPDESDWEVAYTSDNFTVKPTKNGPSFSTVDGKNTVADRLVALIQGAKTSIYIASGHMRSRPVAEALLAKHEADPSIDIRVYLDGQEYISASYQGEQDRKLSDCIKVAAGTSKEHDCYDNAYYFSYVLHQAGIPLRFKYYAYRWDASYAPQMHHKYIIIDGQTVASGSYNLSDNAEHQTLENMVIYRSPTHADVAAGFTANHQAIWETGLANDGFAALKQRIESGTDDIPLVFDSLALTHPQVTELKRIIRTACPAVDSPDYRQNPTQHRWCPR